MLQRPAYFTIFGISKFLFLIVALAFQLNGRASTSLAANDDRNQIPDGSVINLTLHGYNYTNRYIDAYSVDGNGGGNLGISVPGSAGGGSICCVGYVHGVPDRTFKVKWQADACYYTATSEFSSKKFDRLHSIFKSADVVVDSRLPSKPHYFEVHFYPDGQVKAAITAVPSSPRFVLSEKDEDKSVYPRCPNDKKPN